MSEITAAALLCGLLAGGETEVSHKFENLGKQRSVRIDCETANHVIEVGLDHTAGSRDSVHQALFASYVTGKQAFVILVVTDGQEGRYEYEMRRVAEMTGVPYRTCAAGFIERWRMTAAWRDVSFDKDISDLPRNAFLAGKCDLGPVLNSTGVFPQPIDD